MIVWKLVEERKETDTRAGFTQIHQAVLTLPEGHMQLLLPMQPTTLDVDVTLG